MSETPIGGLIIRCDVAKVSPVIEVVIEDNKMLPLAIAVLNPREAKFFAQRLLDMLASLSE